MHPYIVSPLPAATPPATLTKSIKARPGFLVSLVSFTTQFSNGDGINGVLQFFMTSPMTATPLHVASSIITAGTDPRLNYCVSAGTTLVTSLLSAYYGATIPIPEMWFDQIDIESVWIGTLGSWDNSVIVYREQPVSPFLDARARVRTGKLPGS